jgi:hypothetical protein
MPFALKKTRGLKPWQPGQSGNPKGRPVGSRNKLATLVFDEALASFEKRGPAAFEELANKDPARYLILMAQLIPQHFKHEVEHTIAGLSPEEVQLRLAESRAKLLEAGVDLEALPVVEALPAPSDGGS